MSEYNNYFDNEIGSIKRKLNEDTTNKSDKVVVQQLITDHSGLSVQPSVINIPKCLIFAMTYRRQFISGTNV